VKHRICTILGVIVALAALGIVFEAAGIPVRAQPPTTAQVAIDVAALKSDVSTLKDAMKESSTRMHELTSIVEQQVGSNRMLTVVVGILVTLFGAFLGSWWSARKAAPHVCGSCGTRLEP
jgi:hypothetical protein